LASTIVIVPELDNGGLHVSGDCEEILFFVGDGDFGEDCATLRERDLDNDNLEADGERDRDEDNLDVDLHDPWTELCGFIPRGEGTDEADIICVFVI